MLQVNIDIPKPSRYVSNQVIEKIATAYSLAFREQCPVQNGKVLDVDLLTDMLEISMMEIEEDEPEDTCILASTENDPERGVIIIVNERYRSLFVSRPDVYAAAIGHEIGHIVLRHFEVMDPPTEQDSFLPGIQPKPVARLHKSTWGWYGMTKDEIEKLKAFERATVSALVKAASTSAEAREALMQLNSRLEPEWMFWQAECFSRCLLIPADLLQIALQQDWDFSSWRDIYALGRLFGVSGPIMRNRLEKIGVVEVVNGQPRPGPRARQPKLFN